MRLHTLLVCVIALGLGACSTASAPDPEAYRSSNAQAGSSNVSGAGKVAGVGTPTGPSSAEIVKMEEDCTRQGRYYDLVNLNCTDRKLVNVTCTLENITKPEGSDFLTKNPTATGDFLADNQKAQVRDMFSATGKLAGYALKYCVDDAVSYNLVAIKDENGSRKLQEINVPKE